MEIIKTTRETTYEYNGKVYNSIEEIPEEVRKFFEDKDGNGSPDIFDSMNPTNLSWTRTGSYEIKNDPNISTFQISRNGRKYSFTAESIRMAVIFCLILGLILYFIATK